MAHHHSMKWFIAGGVMLMLLLGLVMHHDSDDDHNNSHNNNNNNNNKNDDDHNSKPEKYELPKKVSSRKSEEKKKSDKSSSGLSSGKSDKSEKSDDSPGFLKKMFSVFDKYKSIDQSIVLVPGIFSSRLDISVKQANALWKCVGHLTWIWMNEELMTPENIDCLAEILESKPVKGFDMLDVPGFGDADSLRYLGPKSDVTYYMTGLIDYLIERGFKPESILAAPYDFRYGPSYHKENGYFSQLTNLIEIGYRQHDRPVVLLCHSMGCAMTLYYLHGLRKDFKEEKIEKVIVMAGAIGGSVNAIRSVTYGYDFHLGLQLSVVQKFAEILRSFTSIFFMMPNTKVFGDMAVASYQGKNYTASQIGDFLRELKLDDAAKDFDSRDVVDDPYLGPGLPVHCLYGRGLDTPQQVVVPNLKSLQDPEIIRPGAGDGVVNEISMASCQHWKDNNNGQPVEVRTWPNVNHMDILDLPEAHDYLDGVLK